MKLTEIAKYCLHINNNIWHLHSLSIDESQGYVLEIRVSIRYTLYIRPKPGPVAKNATPTPSGWESNPRPLDY